MENKLDQRKSQTHVLLFYLQKCLNHFTNGSIRQSKRIYLPTGWTQTVINKLKILITVGTLAIKELIYHTRF